MTDRALAASIVARFRAAPASWRFMPLISFEQTTRRWRTNSKTGAAAETWKKRPLAYCSNRDAHVFAAVGLELSDQFEVALERAGLQNVVVGYRRGRSNVTTARAAFEDVQRFGTCTTLALDLEKFFDTIRHNVLKQCWADVVGGALPPSHYAVFRALTRFSTVDRGACLKRLGIPPRTPSRKLARPLCDIDAFRSKVRGRDENGGLITTHSKAYGIPQGTPISAVAANVAMFRFDCALAAEAARVGGTYRRYSDDILLICPPQEADAFLNFLKAALIQYCGGLVLNEEKTRKVEFSGARLPSNVPHMQYLGFLFDGSRALLRPSTVSRFYGRMRRAVAAARIALRKGRFHGSAKGGRPVLQRRKLLRSFTHLGEDSLLSTYAELAGRAFKRRAIMRQFRGHRRRLADLFKKP